MPLHCNNAARVDPHEITNDFDRVPLFILVMIPTFFGTIAKAIGRKDYLSAFLFMLVFVAFFLFQLHLTKFLTRHKHEQWSRNLWLNLNMWFLMALFVGTIYQLADFLTPQFTFTMYTVVLLCSSLMFYFFIMDDLVMCWKIWRRGDWLSEYQISEDGHLNYVCVTIREEP